MTQTLFALILKLPFGTRTKEKEMAPLDYKVELGQARCHSIVCDKKNSSGCIIDAETGCWRFQGSKNTDGYCQVSLMDDV